jgi:hypothetical protein
MRVSPDDSEVTQYLPKEGKDASSTSEPCPNQKNLVSSSPPTHTEQFDMDISPKSRSSTLQGRLSVTSTPLGEDIKVLIALVNNLSIKRQVGEWTN